MTSFMEDRTSAVIATILLLPFIHHAHVVYSQQTTDKALVPALFVFGDSIADNGNNNNLFSLAKANHVPYGRDFPGGVPTGRFVNGYNAIDYFSFQLGLPLLPAHSDPSTKGARLLQGVNFASAASGIEPFAGANFGKVFSMEAQIRQFADVKEEIASIVGNEAAEELVGKSIVYINTGSNDWLNTYFFPGSPLPKLYTRPQYRDLLIAKLLSNVQELYKLGVRMVGLSGLGALGCCPSQLRTYKAVNGTCVQWLNDLASDFNDHLQPQFLALSSTLPNLVLAFQDVFTYFMEVKANPTSHGFSITDHACCGIGKYGGFLNCFKDFPSCANTEDYLFWDAYHPTSKFFQQFVEIAWNNGPPYSYPASGKDVLLHAA